jgi:hypothetical protein
MDLADLLSRLVDLLLLRPIAARRSEARAQSMDKMLAAMEAGEPISGTVPAALHYGEASPVGAHAWKYGRLEITPSAVVWGRGGFLRTRSCNLSGARCVGRRRPEWEGMDKRLSVPGYLADSMQVLMLREGSEAMEAAVPLPLIEVVLYGLAHVSSHGQASLEQ